MLKKNWLQVAVSLCVGISLTCIIILMYHFYFSNDKLSLPYSATTYGPWIEEILKFTAAFLLIRFVYFTSSAVPFIGLGFGFMEQLVYFINRKDFTDKNIIIVWVHIVLGLIMGYFFYLAKKTKYLFLKIIYYILALSVPVILHLAWNMAASLSK
jgi:RsiW-degrading membrane proteinase PrsW (M82 family)